MTDTRQPHDQPAQPVHAAWHPDSHQQPYGGGYPHHAPAGPPGASYYYGPNGPQSGPFAPPTAPQQPTNSLAMPALILGIITLCLSPLPILNQAGILVGLVGTGFAVAALIIGLRRRVRIVMATIALGLSILGLIASFAFTQSFVNSLNSIGSTPPAAQSAPAQAAGGTEDTTAEAPAAPPTFTLSVTGSAKKSSMMWSVDGSSGSADQSTKVPWTKVITGSGQSYHSVSLSANTYPGTPGDLTCTITDQTGRVLDTKTAESQGGAYGSASVSCFGSAY